MNTNVAVVCILAAAMGVAGRVAATGTQFTGATTAQLHAMACEAPAKSDSPWNIKNLYDCSTKTLYVPYQLWTGADWAGAKDGSCIHDGNAAAGIAGPKPWRNPESGVVETVWTRAQAGAPEQYFTCHAKGIGRVYDGRIKASYAGGGCDFPAGPGWALSAKRACAGTEIEITAIALNGRNELESIEFARWADEAYDHSYRYAANVGLTETLSR